MSFIVDFWPLFKERFPNLFLNISNYGSYLLSNLALQFQRPIFKTIRNAIGNIHNKLGNRAMKSDVKSTVILLPA